MEATFRSIAHHGFEGLRLREVAATAGIDHSTLHHYFPTKQDMIVAVVERATVPLYTTIPAGSSPGDRLRDHLRILAEMIETEPDLFVVLAEIDLRARRDPGIRAILDRVEAGWRLGLEHLLDRDTTRVELVIATVKGVRLDPPLAREVLGHLASLLAKANSSEG
ncbi:helix-turn-helix domain-containing protein [Nonomuraea sp. NPDC048916]|uniref:TetR/AcrR family transcriptional regulator n=1 Tax=Nonomuraea sp. NPDC048916 TaxID=3154232 RepID=UPI0033E4AACF